MRQMHADASSLAAERTRGTSCERIHTYRRCRLHADAFDLIASRRDNNEIVRGFREKRTVIIEYRPLYYREFSKRRKRKRRRERERLHSRLTRECRFLFRAERDLVSAFPTEFSVRIVESPRIHEERSDRHVAIVDPAREIHVTQSRATGSRIDTHSKVRPSALGSAMYAPTRSRSEMTHVIGKNERG